MAEKYCKGASKSLLKHPDKIKFGQQPSDIETGLIFKEWYQLENLCWRQGYENEEGQACGPGISISINGCVNIGFYSPYSAYGGWGHYTWFWNDGRIEECMYMSGNRVGICTTTHLDGEVTIDDFSDL